MEIGRTFGKLQRLCAIIVGLVFLLAGIFKIFDPVGAGLMLEEYFKLAHLNFLLPAAKPVAVALAFFESLVGAALISGITRVPVAFITTVMLAFYTLLTLVLAIFNPDIDCGCFGEVIHLTHLQSFLKNVLLMALSLFAFYPYRNLGTNKVRKDISFGIAAALLVALLIYSWVGIPMVDFTAFAPGCELLASSGEHDAQEEYSSVFVYEKNGQQGVFTLDNLPDSTWHFVRTETMHFNRSEVSDATPALPFHDSLGVSKDALAVEGNVLVISVYDPSGIKGEDWVEIAESLHGAKTAGFTPLLLVNSTREAMSGLSSIIPEAREKIEPCTYYADRKVLLSLNRANGGATCFSDGQLIRKFSSRALPDGDYFLSRSGADPAEEMLDYSTKGRLQFEGFILNISAILLLL
ncbi:MAG: DoxX family protein [Candidatus Cryptobacteroides sp.]